MRINRLSAILPILALVAPMQGAQASGTWNGQDTFHVPMSWCVVRGSDAEANPNVSGDTDTDSVIWRRHERPTDNDFLDQTGISFRSAINDTWGTLNFPFIDDPDTTLAGEGDMRGEALSASRTEFDDLITECDRVWDEDLGRAGIGVTAVNARLFHDAAGDYVTVIGWGGCTETAADTCAEPYDGRIVVIDNHYKHPSVADRSWPDGSCCFTPDPWDQLVGHELGHALSLPHRDEDTDTDALMFPNQQDNSGDGNVDNILINNSETTDVRSNAENVSGVEIDPPGQFDPGPFIVVRKVDSTRDDGRIPRHLDLSSVRISLDTRKDRVILEQQLRDLIPRDSQPLDFWFLVNSTSAAAPGVLPQGIADMGLPGANAAIRVRVADGQATGAAWRLDDNVWIPIPQGVTADLNALVMYPHFDNPGLAVKAIGVPVHNVVSVSMPSAPVSIRQGEAFAVQAVTIAADGTATDRLSGSVEGTEFLLEPPSFPHCFPDGDGTPGLTVPVRLEKLRPNAPIHGLLGPRLVFNGMTDENSGGVIDFPIPEDARAGYHLITVGVDGTALTADCTVNVRDEPDPAPPGESNKCWLIVAILLALVLILLVLLLRRRK